MAQHDDLISLRQMLDYSREAVSLLGGRTRESFSQDRVLQLALTRLLEVVGEAATRVSQTGKERLLASRGDAWSECATV